MQNLRKLWAAISGEGFVDAAQRDDDSATAANLRQLLKHCPVCKDGFLKHSYALIATTILGDEEKDQTVVFFKALKEQRWRDLLGFRGWEGLRNNAEAYALRCHTDRVALLVLRSPYEPYDDDELLTCDVLNSESGQELLSLVPQHKWKSLQP